MKNLLLAIVFIFTVNNLFSQDCNSYFPQEPGKKFYYKEYDKKHKDTGNKYFTEVIEKNKIAGGVEVKLKHQTIPKSKNDTSVTMEYSIKCIDGKMIVSLESMMMNQEQMQAYQGMQTEVNADDLSIPENLKAGDDLGGGKVTVKVTNQGVQMISMTMNVLDRKVDVIENITTEAGTFECAKITSHIEFKMLVTLRYTVSDWYAKGIGIVKSETYDKKGKLKSGTKLYKIE